MFNISHKPEKIIVGVGFILISVMLFISPVTTPPDELAHIAYPHTILQTCSLPAYTSSFDAWESHQPPLYYIVSLPFALASSALPFAQQVFSLRLVSFACALFSLAIMAKIAYRVFPTEPISMFAILSFLLIPSVVYAAASFSNDSLVLAVSCALLYACIFFRDKPTIRTSILFGIIIGLALLTKYALYPVLVIAAIWFFWKKKFTHIALSIGLSIVISGWWFIHNIIRTGDITGLTNTFTLWRSQSTIWTIHTAQEFLVKIFASSIGLFGKMQIALPSWCYIAFLFLLIIGLIPIVKKRNIVVCMCLLMVCATFVFVVIQNISFFQPQGRYLFASFPFVAMLLGFGVARLPTVKIKKVFFIFFGISIVLLNSLGFFSIHSFYTSHPLAMLENSRDIDLTKLKWNGGFKSLQPDTKISASFTVYTLADLRILSEKSPTLTGEITSTAATCTVFYKRIGDTQFNKERSFDLPMNNANFSIKFPSQKPTLIQDISLSCVLDPNNGTITIHKLAIITQ